MGSWLVSIPSALVALTLVLAGCVRYGRRGIRWLVLVNGSVVQDADRAAAAAQHAAASARAEAERAARAAQQWRTTAEALESRIRVLEEQLGELTKRENFAQKHIRWLVERVRQLERALRDAGATPPEPAEPEPFI